MDDDECDGIGSILRAGRDCTLGVYSVQCTYIRYYKSSNPVGTGYQLDLVHFPDYSRYRDVINSHDVRIDRR